MARALGYSNGRDAVRKHVEGEDKTIVAICDTGSNYKTQATFINESGLYSPILSCKLESAKRFKHWVTSEVLPSIRKQGGYMVARADESDEVILARALQIMHTALERREKEIALLNPVASSLHSNSLATNPPSASLPPGKLKLSMSS